MRFLHLERLLIVASLFVPMGAFLAAALYSRAEVLREGQETVLRTTAVIHEHTLKIFETEELVLARVQDRLNGLSWDTIGAPEMSLFLASLKSQPPKGMPRAS